MKNIDYEKLTPMMKQYLDTKKEFPDSILMFRMGDFYEMFFDDGVLASKELDIVLTGRDAGIGEKVPMCGVPYHAADNYINRLINKGYKVAICEQLEDPKKAKGLVKRGVTRVITPGTNLAISEDDGSSNFLGSIYTEGNKFSLSYVDFSTGSVYFTFVKEDFNDSNSVLRNQLSILEIKELILSDKSLNIKDIVDRKNILVNFQEKDYHKEEFRNFLNKIDIKENIKDNILNNHIIYNSLLQLYSYLVDTQFGFIEHLRKITHIDLDKYMTLDKHTLYSLDIFSENEKKVEGTLIHLLDKTKTSMGYRKLRYFLEHPLKNESQIESRLNFVETFIEHLIDLDEIRSLLSNIYDIERIMVRLSGTSNSPRDLLQLKKSFIELPKIKNILLKNKINIDNLEDFDKLIEITDILNNSIEEETPLSPKEGGVIKDGFNSDLDDLKGNSINGKSWILDYENELKQETNISKLRIKYNKILGYFVEVSNSHLSKVPDYFIRKQTLVGSERYFTEKLKSTEMTILNSKSKIDSLEFEIYEEIKNSILQKYDLISGIADTIGEIDVYSNFAHISYKNNYVRPSISKDNNLYISKGRHPIVEVSTDIFIDNNTFIDDEKNFIVLTGPNMAGKSTYMRQIALISLMFQIGCFVPADKAKLPIFDRIFTRIGAHDNLYLGDSTFMVEMKEMADIIEHATKDSLIILDEVGRGTSTYDGLALAKALIEYIVENIDAKTIFATHFHELTSLQFKYNKIINNTVDVKEKNGEISFLRKVIEGSSDKSYGIHVATLAGIKESIVRKAKTYLDEYENNSKDYRQIEFLIGENTNNTSVNSKVDEYEKLSDEILDIDLNSMTPIDSMLKIRDLKELIRNLDDKTD